MSIEVENLDVSLGSTPILRSFSLSVATGTWIALVGPNGAGKTTLLRAIAGLVPFRGDICVAAKPCAPGDARAVARLVAYVPQRPLLPSAMTVTDYVSLGRTPHISFFGLESARDHRIVGDVLERLDLVAFSTRALGELSGGESQRVVLARALAQQAPILLLDEPTSALDLGHQQQVLQLTDDLRLERGLTVLSAMHDLTLAAQYAESIVLLASGKLVAKGSAREVFTDANLERHFDAAVHVLTDPDGGVVISPRRAAHVYEARSPHTVGEQAQEGLVS